MPQLGHVIRFLLDRIRGVFRILVAQQQALSTYILTFKLLRASQFHRSIAGSAMLVRTGQAHDRVFEQGPLKLQWAGNNCV